MKNEAYVFSSWSQLSTFVMKKSWAANTEYDRRTTKGTSPDDYRTSNVGGDPYRTLYCLYTATGLCVSWNLFAIAGPCRSVVVDLRLDDDKPFTELEATPILTRVADLWLKQLDADLAGVPCEAYLGTAEPVVWRPSS